MNFQTATQFCDQFGADVIKRDDNDYFCFF